MKTIVTLFLFLSASYIGFSQKIEKQFTGREVETGISVKGTKIAALNYDLPYNIKGYDLDTEQQKLVIIAQLKKKNTPIDGYIFMYDLRQRQLLWYKPVYAANFSFMISKNEIIQNIPGRAICYDKRSGKEKWQGAKTIIFTDKKYDKGIAHNGQVIDAASGKQLSKRFVECKYGVNDIRYIDSSNILIAADGVFKINLADGSGWEYYAKTGWGNAANNGLFIIPVVPGYFLGVITTLAMSAIIADGSGANIPGAYSHACSNLLVDGNRVYFASRESVFCLDIHNGNRIWDIPLPKDKASNSKIWVSGNNLILLNNGYAVAGDELISNGSSYLLSFDKWKGRQYYMAEIGRGSIRSSFCTGDTLIVNYNNKKLFLYDALHGKKLMDMPVGDRELTGMVDFIDPQLHYIRTVNGYEKLSAVFPHDMFLKKDNIVLHVSVSSGNIAILQNSVWEYYRSYNGFDLIRNEKETLLVKNGLQHGRLAMTNAVIFGNTLLDISNQHLQVVNANEVFLSE